MELWAWLYYFRLPWEDCIFELFLSLDGLTKITVADPAGFCSSLSCHYIHTLFPYRVCVLLLLWGFPRVFVGCISVWWERFLFFSTVLYHSCTPRWSVQLDVGGIALSFFLRGGIILSYPIYFVSSRYQYSKALRMIPLIFYFDYSSLLPSFPRDSIWLAMHLARESVGTLTERRLLIRIHRDTRFWDLPLFHLGRDVRLLLTCEFIALRKAFVALLLGFLLSLVLLVYIKG